MSPGRSKPSSLLDTRVIYCGDNFDQLAKLRPNVHRPALQFESRL
jgi:hypothetical protein